MKELTRGPPVTLGFRRCWQTPGSIRPTNVGLYGAFLFVCLNDVLKEIKFLNQNSRDIWSIFF